LSTIELSAVFPAGAAFLSSAEAGEPEDEQRTTAAIPIAAMNRIYSARMIPRSIPSGGGQPASR